MRGADRTPAWAYPLWPRGLCFLGASRLRAALYQRRLFGSVRLPRPAVSVGNLTFGGTGKTPVTLALARLLQEMGEKPAILLRGYGRQSRGARLVSQDSPPQAVGEEALLLARNLPGVPVAVGERREEAAALVPGDTSVFLLDDAFQHLRVARDLDVLLVDASRPGDLHAPPGGRLREPLSAARRAGLILVTRGGPGDMPPALKPRAVGIPAAGARFEWEPELQPAGAGALRDWSGRRVLLAAGVGNAASFLSQAAEAGFDPGRALLLPDHAWPTPERIAQVLDRLAREKCEAVLVTEKDAVKWAPLWAAPQPLLWCRLKTAFEDPSGHLRMALESALGRGV